MAWSRADSRLYRWNGTTWVHFIQESVAGILDETAFAASIRIPRTVTAFPTSGMRIGDLVVLTTDRQFYRWDGTKWTAEVAADLIVGKLTGAQIAAGAIGTDQLAARSVVASILAIADFTNLVPDDQLQDAASWVMGVAFGLRPVTPRNDVKSVGDLYYTHSANVNNNTQYGYMRGFFPVTPGMSFSYPVRSSGPPAR
ncbi:hypothetical protein [Paracoccus cavernae]|uniref:hypothetical protein n=1 Tax=Paracoccus cavernae TaxID=1571207 RepID=UPI0036400A6C